MKKVFVLLAVAALCFVACSNTSGGDSSGSNGNKLGPKILGAISVSKVYTGDYIVGDTLTIDDIIVTAIYTNGITEAVIGWTSDADFSSVATDKTVTISYTEGDVTVIDTITINIITPYTVTYTFTTDATNLLANTDGTAGISATYVEFGDWPQTIKDSSVTIQERQKIEVGMFTYCVGSDGNLYCKALENANGTGEQYKYTNGEQVKQKDANSYKWFKVEPIKWRVVAEDFTGADTSSANKKFLVAENVLMANVPYYDDKGSYYPTRYTGVHPNTITISPNNYLHSTIRAWLNGITYKGDKWVDNIEHKDKGFLQTAFSTEALAKIQEVKVDNSGTSTGYPANKYSCENTDDKIFLLSYKEAFNDAYFSNWNSRARTPTDFAIANYLEMTDSGEAFWFTRSPYWFSDGSGGVRVMGIKLNTEYHSSTLHYIQKQHGIVPALCLAP